MLRTIKLKMLKIGDGKVFCKDENGLKWNVPENIYHIFKYTGFLFFPKPINKNINKILNNRLYNELSKDERYALIVQLLEGVTGEPIWYLFPSFIKKEENNHVILT